MLDRDSAHELAAAIKLEVPLDSYRDRLAPLARATLSGAARSEIDKQMRIVVADVWDGPLRDAATSAIGRLRAIIEKAEGELAGSAGGRLAEAMVDRVLFELLEHTDRNFEAMQELEHEVAAAAPGRRADVARRAARGAGIATSIPRNEIRAAIVRVSRAAAARGFDQEDAADAGARQLARLLATEKRRQAARDWVAQLARINAGPFPVLAEELQRLAAAPAPKDPGHDPIWLETCLGIALEETLAYS